MRMKCVNKVRDAKGNITYYQVIGEDGSYHEVTGQQIKDAISNGQHVFVNLQIDKAGRLVDKAEEKIKLSFKEVETRPEPKKDETGNEKKWSLDELGVNKRRLLKKTNYKGIDYKNQLFAKYEHSWEKKLVLADKFIEDKKKTAEKIKDNTLTEIITCRAANEYKLPSEYIKKMTPDMRKESTELASKFKSLAQAYGCDPVEVVYKIMSDWCINFDITWFEDMKELTEPYYENDEGEQVPFIDMFSYWIKIHDHLYLCWD